MAIKVILTSYATGEPTTMIFPTADGWEISKTGGSVVIYGGKTKKPIAEFKTDPHLVAVMVDPIPAPPPEV